MAASSSALATSSGTSVVSAQNSVPQGVRVKWFQRKETLSIDIEVPGVEELEVFMTDEGLVELKAKSPKHCVTLQLLHRIHTEQSRWHRAGRTIKLELAKAEYGRPHWDRLVVGEKLSNVLVDWTSWIDEAEENEIRNAPYGYDAHHMAGAMGAHWGSNVERTIKARAQAAKVDPSNPNDEEEDEITMG